MTTLQRTNKEIFAEGLKAGIPIGIGYFAVSFSLGIIARDCGFNAFQGFLTSLTSYASAGQYVGFTVYGEGATLLQLVIMMIVTNARYLLMGVALNQKVREGTSLLHRIMIGLSITDEIFGVSIARPGY
ncbi:MAG: AzlC family ABC transporter permease, partial [Firmicutes bacterium]|nr:AzlC family ABC transporter permease [Bacillota bacterium]